MPRLILTRKLGEETLMYVPGYELPFVVSLVRHGPNSVRLAFEAPQEVVIVRAEIDRGGPEPAVPHPAPVDPAGSLVPALC